MTEEELQLIREQRNKYMREYRANNKDKISKINKRYWLKKAQQELEV